MAQLSEIRTDARYLVSPQLTSSEYDDTAIDRNINHWYRTGVVWAILAQGSWQVRGGTAYIDTEADEPKYPLPVADILRLERIEVKMSATSDYVKAVPTDLFQLRFPEANATRPNDNVDAPTVDLIGNDMVIRPAPTATVVNGIKIWLQRTITPLDDSNDIPDLADPIQRLLAYGAAYDYALAEEMYRKANELKSIIFGTRMRNGDFVDGIRQEIEDLYTLRSGLARRRITAGRRNFK